MTQTTIQVNESVATNDSNSECKVKIIPRAAYYLQSKRNIRILRLLVYQNAVIRPLTVYMASVILLDKWDEYKSDDFIKTLFNTVNVVSMTFALYGVHVLTRTTSPVLQHLKLIPLMRFVQFFMVLYGVQAPIFLWVTSCWQCNSLLPNQSVTNSWALRSSQNMMFDVHPCRLQNGDKRRRPVMEKVENTMTDSLII
ncbi:unnamed protein product [Soboliphyme baturini]|uniref:Bestrophin homolog n=1 Tax=Soboliphyme baturini TaxID=241478 RepID=A0A183IUA5_9BILA|nr:unnamed protein product [Soboliphyme baturini]